MGYIKKIALALLASLCVAGTAQAGVLATALFEIENFLIKDSDGKVLDADTDFVVNTLSWTGGADEDVALDGATDSRNDPNSTTGIDFPAICVGDCPQIGDNAFPVISGAPSANYATADQVEDGAPISNVGSFATPATVGNGAYVGIATGEQTGSANSNNALEANWIFQLANPAGGVTLEMDLRAYVEAFVSAGELSPGKASANTDFEITLTDLATGQVVFSAKPAVANQTVSVNANNFDVPRQLTGIHTAGEATAESITLTTPPLNNTSLYQLSVRQNVNADAARVEPVLASLGDRVWEDRDANGIQDCQDTNGNGIIGDAGDTGPECDAGIPGIFVNLLAGDCSASLGMQATTDADGFYLFDNLTPGDYCVEFEKPGDDFCQIGNITPGDPVFTEKNVGNDDTIDSDADTDTGVSDAVSLAAGDSNLTVDAGLYCPAKLGDMLIEDLDRDGIQDPGEPGIQGQQVTLIMCVNGVPGAELDTTVTGPDGMYMFNPLEPGEYAVIFSKPDGTVFSPQNQGGDDTVDCDTDMNGLSQCVTLGTREYNDTVDACVNRPPAGLGDRVWEDEDADGIQDPGELGIPDVPVSLLGPGNDGECNTGDEGAPIDTTLTDANGLYEFINLEPGRYCVEFEKPDICDPTGIGIGGDSTFSPSNQGGDDAVDSDADTTTGQTGNIDLDPEEFDPTNDAGVYCPAKIGDLVWNDLNEDGIQDGNEPGLGGVAVNLYDCGPDGVRGTLDDGGDVNPPTSTDVAGMYMFNPLPPGNYSIECEAPAGYMFSPQDQGGDDAADSDADPATGQTVCTNLESNEYDPTWDCGLFEPQDPRIVIEKATNGVDADDPNAGDAPQVAPGDLVTWEYKVTNTGNVDLVNVEVIDDQLVAVTCPQDVLAVGEMMTCEASGFADDLVTTTFTTVPGLCGGFPDSLLYENMGRATGDTERGEFVEDDDPSHYCNPPGGGGQGCTPGFWKNPKKFAAWFNPPYSPSTPFSDVFEDAFPGKTLLGVLKLGGGGLEALGRHSVAALLNAATADVDYDYASPAEVIAAFNAAYLGGDADEIEDQKDVFDVFNNQGCPINGKSPPSNL